MAATQASAYLVLGVVGIGSYVAYKLLGRKRNGSGGSSGGATGSGGSSSYYYPEKPSSGSSPSLGASWGAGNKNSGMEQSSPYSGVNYVQQAMKGFDAANGETFKQEGAEMLDAGASNSFLSATPSIANYQFQEEPLSSTSSFDDWFSNFSQPLSSDNGTLDSSDAGVAATESVSDLGDVNGDQGYDVGDSGSSDYGSYDDVSYYDNDGGDGGGDQYNNGDQASYDEDYGY